MERNLILLIKVQQLRDLSLVCDSFSFVFRKSIIWCMHSSSAETGVAFSPPGRHFLEDKCLNAVLRLCTDPLSGYLVFSFLDQQVFFNYCSVHNIARNQIPSVNSYSSVISCCTAGNIRGAVLTKH